MGVSGTLIDNMETFWKLAPVISRKIPSNIFNGHLGIFFAVYWRLYCMVYRDAVYKVQLLAKLILSS